MDLGGVGEMNRSNWNKIESPRCFGGEAYGAGRLVSVTNMSFGKSEYLER